MKFGINLSRIQIEVPEVKEAVVRPFSLTKKVWVMAIAGLTLISSLAWGFYYQQGLTLAYNDARSHLNVARRVIDSLQPGAAQIGSVWLPLYHVLELPLIWNNFLWHTGLAGSIVSMVSFIIGGLFILKIAEILEFDLGATIIALGIYVLNPNLLFLQATPMTESLLISLNLAAAYYFIKWAKTYKATFLILAAFATFLATLARYDGWFMLGFLALAVIAISWKKGGYKEAEGNFFLFCTLAGFGVILWFLWNLAIFHDPFYFATGQFSAKAQQDVLLSEGRLLTKGNPIYSFFVYVLTVGHNLGIWVSVLSLLGSWYIFVTKHYTRAIKIAIIAALSAPFLFNIISLIIGFSVIHLPEIPPYTWFNDRYGLMVLPAAAILIGMVVNKKKKAAILVGLLLLVQTSSSYIGNNIITIEDGVRGASGDFLDQSASWMKDNIHQGLIFVAASSNDALLFHSGFDLKRFIVEGDQKYWEASIKNPTIYADWVVMHKGDLVDKSMRINPLFLNNYRLVYHDSFSFIYKREIGTKTPVTIDTLP